MTLILVRHGETPLNVTRILQPADTPLSENGLAQARAVAKRLAGMQLSGIVSSDLPRALVTAQTIAAATGLSITTTPLLHERNFGDLRGKPYDSLGFDPLAQHEAPPNGESTDQFNRRVAQAFAHIVALRESLGGHLAVVTHGLVIRAMLSNHALREDASVALPRIGNTSICVLDAVAPHAVGSLDCTKHLSQSNQHDAGSLSGG